MKASQPGGAWLFMAWVGALGMACSVPTQEAAPAAAVPTDGCVVDGDCDPGQRCDAAREECLPAVETVVEPAKQNVVADAACDVETQAGCAEGRVCLVVNNKGRTGCYSVGTGTRGAACSTINDCASGLLCVGAQCRDRCGASTDCDAAPFTSCSPLQTLPNQPAIAALSTCAIHCNPADPENAARLPGFDACSSGATCFPHNDGARGSTDCYVAGTVPFGGACSVPADCVAGGVCLSDFAGRSGVCRALCLMRGSSCPGGACLPFGEPFFVGAGGSLVEVGYCD